MSLEEPQTPPSVQLYGSNKQWIFAAQS